MLDSLADHWPTISALLDEALALPPADRTAWLAALPAEHQGLGDTLQALLASQAGVETSDFLGTLPKLSHEVDASTAASAAQARVGETVGPYRLLEAIGSGGMGDVWLAERADGELKRRVALKLPHLVWGGALAERMHRERDILASLEHPNISRLYDAGVDQHGRPYLALEYVEGQAIDIYCRERESPLSMRLDLLLQACAAVSHAHSRLVVHRDLKPSNIMVTLEGNVRLLDFGIAKLMQSERTADTALTRLSGRAMTIDYASPEQIRGEPLGTTSDVYSLGVVAYELLAGARPYRLKRGSAAELEEAIAQIDPPRASDAAEDPAAKRQLRGDLDAVLTKALKKDAGQRYPTVEALAQDLQRYRVGRAVHALPDSRVYRTKKFMRRNLLALVMTTAVGAAVITGSGVAVWQALAAREQAAYALASANRLDGIVDLYVETMTELSVMAAENPSALTRPLAVTRALQDKLRELGPRFAARPSERQGQLKTVALQLNFSNEFDLSLAVGQEYLVMLKMHDASADTIIQAHQILGRTLFQLGRLEESEAMRRAGVDWAPRAGDDRTELTRLLLMSDLGGVLTVRGKRPEARAVLLHGESLAQSRFGNLPPRFLNLFKLSEFYLGFDDMRALDAARRAYAGIVASGAGTPEDESWARTSLSVALMATGGSAEAEPLLRKVLETNLRQYGRDSRNAARATARVAEAMARQGKYLEVREMLSSELRTFSAAHGTRSASAPWLRSRQIENELLYGDRDAGARLVSADWADLLRPQAIRENHPVVRFEALALAASGQGRAALERGEALVRGWPDPDAPTAPWLRILDTLAITQLAAGENAGAGKTARRLLDLLDAQQARTGWAYRSAAEMAALAAARASDQVGAASHLALADAITPQPQAPSSVARAESALRRAEVLEFIGRPADAVKAGRAALVELAGQHPDSPRLAEARRRSNPPAS